MKNITALLLVLTLLPLINLHGQNSFAMIVSPLRDPRIPSGEESRYVTQVNDDRSYSRTVVRILEDEQAYQIRNITDTVDSTLTITQRGLIPIRQERRVKTDDSEFNEATTLSRAPRLSRNDILVLSFDDLPYLLRGYSFSNPRSLRVYTATQDNADNEDREDGFSVHVEYRGRETITLRSTSYEAHKLELVFQLPGIAALFAGAVPKTYFWYDIRAPHRLLRHEGPNNFNFGGEQETFRTELVGTRILSN